MDNLEFWTYNQKLKSFGVFLLKMMKYTKIYLQFAFRHLQNDENVSTVGDVH